MRRRGHVLLASASKKTVSEDQFGIIAGRQISEAILRIEASMVQSDRYFCEPSVAILLDMAAAFPSVAHSWLFFVLDRMRPPPALCVALAAAYAQLRTRIAFGGAVGG